jgi:hypothetical protein
VKNIDMLLNLQFYFEGWMGTGRQLSTVIFAVGLQQFGRSVTDAQLRVHFWICGYS